MTAGNVRRDVAGDFELTDRPGPAPEAFYNCALKRCDECTYPADMLQWWDGVTVEAFDAEDQPCAGKLHPGIRSEYGGQIRPGWYCDSCVEHFSAITGPSLRQHLEAAP